MVRGAEVSEQHHDDPSAPRALGSCVLLAEVGSQRKQLPPSRLCRGCCRALQVQLCEALPRAAPRPLGAGHQHPRECPCKPQLLVLLVRAAGSQAAGSQSVQERCAWLPEAALVPKAPRINCKIMEG